MLTIFTCQDRFEDMMTCIYDAWASRLGHKHVRLQTEPMGTLELFCEYRPVSADLTKTQSVIRTIQQKISYRAYTMVYRAAMSSDPDKLDTIYRFLILGFSQGPSILHRLQEPAVFRLSELDRTVANEVHRFQEFIRFSSLLQHPVLVSHIEPKSNLLTLVAPYFSDRLPSENWMIIDDIRHMAIIHPANRDYYLTPLSESDQRFFSKQEKDPFSLLWKEFFRTIGIRERRNSRCQRTMLPLWYRKHMTEFN